VSQIFVNGSFDILHRGHLELLKYAKSLGTVLVAIDTDRRISELKGTKRPINCVNDRKFHLESLKYVDKVSIFDSDQELIDLVKSWNTNIMIKGSDYKNTFILGSEYCNEIRFYDRTIHSTTKTIQDIIDR
jgi:D-beta-D-heptose 7-phosphate kinase/D-beta-D-heptose 1-phosphate adenosyltransferase